MRLINESQKIIWEKIYQCRRGSPWFSTIKMARIILNSLYISHFIHHLEIIFNTRLDSLGCDNVSSLLKIFETFRKFGLDNWSNCLNMFDTRHCMRSRKKHQIRHRFPYVSHKRLDNPNSLYFCSKKFHTIVKLLARWKNLQCISQNTEHSLFKICRRTIKLKRNKMIDKIL